MSTGKRKGKACNRAKVIKALNVLSPADAWGCLVLVRFFFFQGGGLVE